MIIKIGAALLCAILLAGCAASGPTYTELQNAQANTTPAEQARVVVFRTNETQYSARAASIRLDGEFLGKCDYKGFNAFDVTPGQHKLRVDMWDSPGSCTVPVNVDAGKVYYFEIKPRVGNFIGGLLGGVAGAAIESAGKECGGAYSVEAVSKDQATIQLTALRQTK